MNENLLRQFERLPELLGSHLRLSMQALAIGMMISLPLAIMAARQPRLRWPVLAMAGVIQTIPSLALLALMVPLLGAFGYWPALVALVLYSMLPMLRNTITGLAGVDRNLIEAARGLGMTPMQTLCRVELPLAMPVILAGVRTATVWVVGIATLSTPVGQASLGNYIFSGLQTRNWTAVMFGCIAAACLAIVLDQLIALLESAAARRSLRRAITSVMLLALVFALGFIPTGRASVGEGAYLIGSKTFTEQYILSRLMEDRLRESDLPVRRLTSLGSTVAFDALRQGQIDCYVDYTGTIWTNYMKADQRQATDDGSANDSEAILAKVTDWLADEHDITCMGPLGFENTYALAMRREDANRLGIRTIADLATAAPGMKIGGDYEFFERPEWTTLLATYGLRFADQVSLDGAFMYSALMQDEVEVIAAFSSDGRIAANDLVVLEDPRQAFPPYDAVLLLSSRAAGDDQVIAALKPLIGAIDVELMRQANQKVDLDKQSIRAAAIWLGESAVGATQQ